MNLHPEQPLLQPGQRVSPVIPQINQPLNKDHLPAPSDYNLCWLMNASLGSIYSNQVQPKKGKSVLKSKWSSLAQEKNRKSSNLLLNHLSVSLISMNLKLPKLQREEGVVRESSKKHHHQVIHPNQMMIKSHDNPQLNLVKLPLKRKRSMSPISLGLCETNSSDLNCIPNYEPPSSSFKCGQPTLNKSKPASLILQDVQLFLTWSGLTSSKEKPLILTVSSPASTLPQPTINVLKILEKSSSNLEPRIHQNQSPLTETGPSHLTLPICIPLHVHS